MNKRLFLTAFVLAASLFAGCSDKAPPSGASAAPSETVVPSEQVIQAGAKGFAVGSVVARRTVYVFFDAQCPHCGALWEAAKPLASQAKFVWIPVAFMGKASIAQGAALLAAADPLVAMNEHEQSLAAHRGGIAAMSATDALRLQVDANTKVLNSFSVASIPWTFTVDPTTGQPVIVPGARPTADYARALGLTPPATVTPTNAAGAGQPAPPAAGKSGLSGG